MRGGRRGGRGTGPTEAAGLPAMGMLHPAQPEPLLPRARSQDERSRLGTAVQAFPGQAGDGGSVVVAFSRAARGAVRRLARSPAASLPADDRHLLSSERLPSQLLASATPKANSVPGLPARPLPPPFPYESNAMSDEDNAGWSLTESCVRAQLPAPVQPHSLGPPLRLSRAASILTPPLALLLPARVGRAATRPCSRRSCTGSASRACRSRTSGAWTTTRSPSSATSSASSAAACCCRAP